MAPSRTTTQATALGAHHQKGDGAGGVKAAWGPDGSFNVTLALPKVDEGDVNCVTGKCSIYTSSDDPAIRTEDNAVPVTFAAPPPPTTPTTPTSTPPTSTAPTTPTAPSTPGTAIVQVISTPDIEAGKTQLVVFSGFAADEQVNLTLFSDPITLSPVTADPTGVASAEFVVPADFPAGTHRLEAIGQQSGTVGVASFRVTAPPPPTTAVIDAVHQRLAEHDGVIDAGQFQRQQLGGPEQQFRRPDHRRDPDEHRQRVEPVVALADHRHRGAGRHHHRRSWCTGATRNSSSGSADEQAITDAAAREQQAGPGAGYDGADAPTVLLPPVRPGRSAGRARTPTGCCPVGTPGQPDLYSGRNPAGPTEVLGGPRRQPAGSGPYGSARLGGRAGATPPVRPATRSAIPAS